MKKHLITYIILFWASLHCMADTYANYSQSWGFGTFTQNAVTGQGTVAVSIQNDVLTVTFNATFAASPLKQGAIVTLATTPKLHDVRLGAIAGNGYEAFITNGSLTIAGSGQPVTGFGVATPAGPVAFTVNLKGTPKLNYITETDVLKDDITSPAAVLSAPVKDASIQKNYFDGLGRPVQQVMQGNSPAGFDQVQPVSYDGYGRETVKYLPYASAQNNGSYQADALQLDGSYQAGKQYQFYQTAAQVARDTKPHAVTVLEASPLNRPLEQGAPGQAWQPGGGHTIGMAHEFNTTEDAVNQWDYEEQGPETFGPVKYKRNYPPSSLHKFIARDERGKATITFKDAADKVLLRRVEQGTGFLNTYYVYDVFGNLRAVIPPQGYEAITKPLPADYQLTADFLTTWCFTYLYDLKNRVIEKNIPGAGTVYLVYGRRDELLLSQDARQRAGYSTLTATGSLEVHPAGEWSFNKYDGLGRVVMTGLYRPGGTPATRATMQGDVDADPGAASGKDYEERQHDPALFGYTMNRRFPALDNTRDQVLMVYYYDDYNFDYSGIGTVQRDREYVTTRVTPDPGPFYQLAGKPTATRVRRMDNKEWLWQVNFYDLYGRVIQTQADNHLGRRDVITTVYDFAGKVLSQLANHSGRTDVIVQEDFTYDHAGRMLTHYHQVNNQARVILRQNSYNELGQLVEKKLHGVSPDGNAPVNITLGTGYPDQYDFTTETKDLVATGEITLLNGFWAREGSNVTARIGALQGTTAQHLQTANFDYNIRGWLTHINDAALRDSKDLFGMELIYNQGTDLNGVTLPENQKQYNGNIAAQKWKTNTETAPATMMYTYGYDDLNRLTKADFTSERTSLHNAFSVTSVGYSANGNITGLAQSGLSSFDQAGVTSYGAVDNLTYVYTRKDANNNDVSTGNRLMKVIDGVTNQGIAGDFQDGTNLESDYDYDAAGSLTKDENKKITSILYNHLNLPEKISFGASSYIRYVYRADGVKLFKEVVEQGMSDQRTDYAGGAVYVGDKLQFVPTAEGRLLSGDFTQDGSSGYVYEYHYKDHLGNLRLAFRETSKAVTFTATMEVVNAY
ncbi:MAG: hypothetical protein ICV83_01000, partial [Cytophagales bacterium]|nr:hypothetical protein [Cytophagales bacterium]